MPLNSLEVLSVSSVTARRWLSPKSRRAVMPGLVAALICVLMMASAVVAQTAGLVRDFAEIQIGDVTVVADPSGTSATIEVSTSIDAACAVVFGEDETFGRLATDVTMSGGGHRDHRVLLGGLRPGSTYVFRLQGSGADGSLYQSRLFALDTSEGSSSAADNLALGAGIAAVSSEFSAAFAAPYAVDGDPSTEWSSQGDGDDAYITLDLGRTVHVTAVAFHSRQMADGSAITETFSVTAVGAQLGPFPAGSDIAVEITAQIIRFDVETSTGGNTGAVEIAITGAEP